MRLVIIGLILSFILVFAVACSQTDTANLNTKATNVSKEPTTPVDKLASAKKNFSEHCVKCHKEDGKGGVTEVDGKEVRAPNFSEERIVKREDAEYIDAIQSGFEEDGMPSFKDKLSPDEMNDLVKFIRRDFQDK